MRGVRQRAKEQRNVNGSWAGDAKAGKTLFLKNQIRKKIDRKKLNEFQRKKEMRKVQRKVRTKQNDSVKGEI